jgi:hypothetical protein
VANKPSVPLNNVLPVIFNNLPLKEDQVRAPAAYRIHFCLVVIWNIDVWQIPTAQLHQNVCVDIIGINS